MTRPLSATVANCAGHRTDMRTEREQLTSVLRALAAELDDLDRRLSDISWTLRDGRPDIRVPHAPRDRAALMVQRDRMNARLQGLARQLGELDNALSTDEHHACPPAAVGTCPDCGYPSLGSGLCASCRLYLVR